MKKLSYLIILALILGLVLTGCLLSNVGQVPTSGQSGIAELTKGIPLSDADLIALWHFDGNVDDSSENGLNGTLSPSGASFVVDGLRQVLNVDGTGWVQVTDSVILEPPEITVEAWVKRLGSPGGAKYIVSKYLPDRIGSYSSYGLYTGSGGIRFYIGYNSSWIGSPQASAMAVWNGEWHHVAGTFDGVNIKLYLDGVQVDGATSTIQDIYYSGTGNLYIGAYTNSSFLAFSGMIDEVRIWDGALTADEILYSYADETLHVDDDWAQWPGAYYTINEALAVAGDGDTIIVHEGTYTNDIWDGSSYRIDKSVTLLGAQAGVDPAGSTDDRGGETILVRTNGVPYSITAPNVVIDGFMNGDSTANSGGRFIISPDADNVIIRNCIIQNTPSASSGHGVYIYPGAENALIEYNTFSNTAWEAIRCDGNAVISNNTIKDIPTNKGIFLGGTSNAQVIDNVITNTFYEGIQSYASVTITRNEITGCFNGIQIRGSATNSVIRNNLIVDSKYWGIDVQSDITAAVITNNTVIGSGYCGVTIWTTGDGSGFLVNRNSFDGSGIYGVESKTSTLIDATCNWWGDNSGPSGVGPGTGDAVSANVDYNPWLTDNDASLVYTGAPQPVTSVILEATLSDSGLLGISGMDVDFYLEGVEYVGTGITDENGVASKDIGPLEVGIYEVYAKTACDLKSDTEFLAVYDPSAGFVTGGGWIYSEAGAYVPDPSAEGKATFGFVSKYKKGAAVPTGNTEFQFKAGDLNFHSDSYDWLVIAGDKAKYKGTGTINGTGDYGFMLTATDSDSDLFRIKIQDKTNGDVIYDNKMDSDDTGYDGTELGGGQIIVHKGK